MKQDIINGRKISLFFLTMLCNRRGRGWLDNYLNLGPACNLLSLSVVPVSNSLGLVWFAINNSVGCSIPRRLDADVFNLCVGVKRDMLVENRSF